MIYCIIMVNWLIRLIITKTKVVTRDLLQWYLNTESLDSEPSVPNHCTTGLGQGIAEEIEVCTI